MAETFKTITNVPGWVEMLTSDGVPDSVATLYKRVPILFRAVQLRCDALSAVPVNIYKGEENEVEWPYPTNLGELLWRWEASLLLSGGAYGEIIANKSGFRKDVRYRNPFDMSVKYEGGIISFRQNSSGATWQNDPKAGKYEMLYLAEYDPTQDVLPGIGSAMASTVDSKLLYAISKFPEMYFEGGAMPVTLLGIDTNDRQEIERIQNWFRKSATAIKNAFRILGVRAGSITPTTLTPSLDTLAFPELNDIAKDNIAMAFGIKQTLLDSESANYATASEDRKSFYTETIMPRARLFEDALNTQLLARDGLRIEFKFNEMDIFQTDESERADLLHKLMNSEMPIELALDLAGYELTDEQLEVLRAFQREKGQHYPETQLEEEVVEEVAPVGGVPRVDAKYSPDQPREAAGSPRGGQWTDGSGGGGNQYMVRGVRSGVELPVYVVPGGGVLPKWAFENANESKFVPVIYNAETNTWHIASTEEFGHGNFARYAKEGIEKTFEEEFLVRGYLGRGPGGSVEMNDVVYMIPDIIGDKYQYERRLIAALNRVARRAEHNSFSFYDITGTLVSPRVQWNKIILPPKNRAIRMAEYSPDQPTDPQATELRKWQKMAEKRLREGKELRAFESDLIEPALHGAITGALETVKTVDEVKNVFDSVIEWRGYP